MRARFVLLGVGLLQVAAVAGAQDPSQPYLQPPPQTAPAPPPGDYPPEPGAYPPPQPQPGVAPTQPPQQAGVEPQAYPPAQPQAGVPQTQTQTQPPQPPPTYGQPPPQQAQPATPYAYAPPPRPQPEQEPEGRTELEIPGFSIRLDPLEMLLEGRFGPQLEVELLRFMSVELVPMFFLTDSPFVLDLTGFVGRDAEITQHSNGIGPLVGASLGVAFWLGGRAFRNYALRAMITNFGVEYQSHFDGNVVDRVTFTERRFQLMLESMSRIGVFTISTGFGIGYELNPSERCDLTDSGPGYEPTGSGCDELQIAVEDGPLTFGAVDLFGPLHPWSIIGRFALGVTFD